MNEKFDRPQGTTAPLADWVRTVPDWPVAGVQFRDLTPLWADGSAWARTVARLARPYDADPPAVVLGIEARGFVVAAALAARWGAGILLARKPGKLPAAVHREDYALEYGTAAIEAHRGVVPVGARVLIADDVLATGGTAFAALALTRALEVRPIGFAFILEIEALGGRARLGDGLPIEVAIAYDGDGTPREP